MICESCKFENRDGAMFCAECGKPLIDEATDKLVQPDEDKTVLLDAVVTNSRESLDNKMDNVAKNPEEKSDDSESNTTVLTSDMLKPAQNAALQGFVPAQTSAAPVAPMAPNNQAAPQIPKPLAPQASNNQVAPQMPKPLAPQASNNQVAPQMPKPVAPQASNNQVASQMANPVTPQVSNNQAAPQIPKPVASQAQGNQTAQQALNNQAATVMSDKKVDKKADEKTDKKAEKKAAKAQKKTGTGTKVYIAFSIILILAMAGAMVWGYFYHTDKISQKDKEIDNWKASATDAQTQAGNLDNELATAQTQIDTLNTDLAAAQTAQADAELALAEAQATAANYQGYDKLIEFVKNHSANSSTDMMVSDTVVYTTVGSTVDILVYFPSQNGGELVYTASDGSVVACEWGDEWVNGSVLPLHINALASGDITIEITNDQNEIKEVVFVHVE